MGVSARLNYKKSMTRSLGYDEEKSVLYPFNGIAGWDKTEVLLGQVIYCILNIML